MLVRLAPLALALAIAPAAGAVAHAEGMGAAPLLATAPAEPSGQTGDASAEPMVPNAPPPMRGQPRVSRTRCALVTCEKPCAAQVKPAAQSDALPASSAQAPCPVRRQLG